MKLIILIILILPFGCVSKPSLPHSDKSVISHSWLTKKISIDDIHESENNICLFMEELEVWVDNNKQEVNNKESKCIKKTGNPFKHELKKGYRVFEYRGREGRRLEKGYALVVDGVIVEVIVDFIAE